MLLLSLALPLVLSLSCLSPLLNLLWFILSMLSFLSRSFKCFIPLDSTLLSSNPNSSWLLPSLANSRLLSMAFFHPHYHHSSIVGRSLSLLIIVAHTNALSLSPPLNKVYCLVGGSINYGLLLCWCCPHHSF